MIGKTKINKRLRKALDRADPNMAKYPEIKRKRILYPICNFTHALKEAAKEYSQIIDITFHFPKEAVEQELTICTLKLSNRIIRLTYNHKTESVFAFSVGRNYDGGIKEFSVTDLVKEIKEYLPKKVVIIKKKASPKQF